MIETLTTDRRTVDHLIQDLEDGVITEQERTLLMELMRNNASVRDLYVKHTEMVALLQQSAQSRFELGTMPISQSMLVRERRRGGIISLAYGIAALLFLGVSFFIFHTHQQNSTARSGIVMQGSQDAQYTITYTGDDVRDSTNLQKGDRISVSQGLVKLKFPSGVVALVEGPSSLELTSDLSVKMDGGLGWFRVPPAGHGFRVETKGINVVDLGTEFGVWFNGEDSLQVHVSKGKVRIEPILKVMPKVELTANEAMQFNVYGQGERTNCRTSLFRQTFTESMPYLHWSFDQLDKQVFPANGTIPGKQGYGARLSHLRRSGGLNSETSCEITGRFGGAFRMDSNGLCAETSFSGIGGNAPRTVAAWIRHRKSFYSTHAHGVHTPYVAWGSRDHSRAWKVFMSNQHKPTLCTSIVESELTTSVPVNLSREWMHIASVYTGRKKANGYPEIFHYINGVRQNSIAAQQALNVNTDVSSPKAKTVRFGVSLLAKDTDHTVDGDIDEAYIFRGVLNESQIRKLMQSNRLEFFSK